MPFDPTKPVMTRDGRKARIICTDRKGMGIAADYPVVALITCAGGDETLVQRTRHGRELMYPSASCAGRDDLVNVEQHTVVVEVYRNENTGEVYVVRKGEFGHHRDGANYLLATRTVEVTYPATQDEA